MHASCIDTGMLMGFIFMIVDCVMQRIEALWAQLGKLCTYWWRELFQVLHIIAPTVCGISLYF